MNHQEAVAKGRQCIEIEIEALGKTAERLDERFAEAVFLIERTVRRDKKLLLSGVGKSAHVCEKLVGTFNSIGAPACFIDPVRALHGDMGLCREGDVLLAFSHGGETEELLRFAPLVKRFDLATVAVTSRPESSLAALCDLLLPYHVDREACPLELAPTASAVASMALGDALAMVLLEALALSKEGFARFHPGGSLGRALAPRVDSIMRSDRRFARLPETARCRECLRRMSNPSSGSVALTAEDGTLSGVLTDGDVRRLVLDRPGFLDEPASKHMTRRPVTIRSGSLAAEALKIFQTHAIDDLIVVDEAARPVGIIDGQDLTKVRLV